MLIFLRRKNAEIHFEKLPINIKPNIKLVRKRNTEKKETTRRSIDGIGSASWLQYAKKQGA